MPGLQLLAALVLLGANFFFVAVEFAVTRARPTEVAELESQGVKGSRSLRHAVDNIDAYLSACQLGITLASIGLGIFGERALRHLIDPAIAPLGALAGASTFAISFALAYGIVSAFHVVLGELAPKSLAIARTRRSGLLLAPPMRLFYLATKPVVDALNWAGNLVLRPFGIPPAREAGHTPHSEPELRRLLGQSERAGILDTDERQYAENVLLFGDRRVREIMVPRPEVDHLTAEQTVREAAEILAQTRHTRLPLAGPKEGLDAADGFVHIHDVLAALYGGREDEGVPDLARKLPRIPDSILIDEALRMLRPDGHRIALVVDEYGTAVGILTLRDILEEIVGDIRNEFDHGEEGPEPMLAEAQGVRIRGDAPVSQVADELGIELGDSQEATIGGYVVGRLGRVPEIGEKIDLDGLEVEVNAVEEARVAELYVCGPPPNSG
ncbi:MAG: DUF21 domain-containing protein [Streptosporangiales bacterium]|nr:DUF21 domain-containing protein [Streptosporangiales bacterium]